MKTLLTLIFLATSLSTLAQDLMTHSERNTYVEQVAKDERRTLYIAGHDYVGSSITYPSLSDLDQYFSKEERYESYLDSDEIASVYRCFYAKACLVYHIGTSSEYWGGYGVEGAFVLLNIEMKNHSTFRHTIYSE
tara:strand:+ start:304 stop:708 length:405 start_codon:yes stop_codon:yes gene_type:complete